MHKIKGRNSSSLQYNVFVAKFRKIKNIKNLNLGVQQCIKTFALRGAWYVVLIFIIIYFLEMEGNNDKKDSDVRKE